MKDFDPWQDEPGCSVLMAAVIVAGIGLIVALIVRWGCS